MSTEKEKCNGTKAEWLLEFEKMVKDNSFVTPSSHLNVLAIQDFISKAIASAVEAREQQIEEAYKKGYSDRDKQPICAIIPTEKQNIDFAVEAREREIKSDLLKVADEIEGEELRSEVERYFKTIL